MSTVDLTRMADWRWCSTDYSTPTYAALDNTAITDHDTATDLIVCMTAFGDADACNKATPSHSLKFQVQKDGGGYVDIASGSGDVRCVSDTITGFTDGGTCLQRCANTLVAICNIVGFVGNSTQMNGDATAPGVTLAS